MTVTVPEELRIAVLRALVTDIRRRQLVDGGAVLSPAMRSFLHALSAEPAATDPTTSARGSAAVGPANVAMTTEQIADHIGCSTRWAREIARRAGATKQGRDWVITPTDLDRFMTTREDTNAQHPRSA